MSFASLGLSEALAGAVEAAGYTQPTPVQQRAIPAVLQGRDLMVAAQTGTGKTGGFALPVLELLFPGGHPDREHRYGPKQPRVLVLTPTRELAAQVHDSFKVYARDLPLKSTCIFGGVGMNPQIQAVAKGLDVLVACPGRLLDLANQKAIDLSHVEILVLDEADRMLDMGFIPQVRQIIRQTPPKSERQTLLFSATFTDDVMNLAQQWTTNPAVVEIEPENVASDTVEQHVFAVAGSDKYKLLYNLITQNDWTRVMVFANRKDEVRRIEERLTRDGISAAQMSGDVPQHKRIRTLEGFREGKIRVLVATDVAGRGIHVDGISHVINFTLPEDPDDYVHRIGRTGRAGSSGTSISFAGEDDSFALPPIEALIGRKIQCEMPSAELLAPVPHSR